MSESINGRKRTPDLTFFDNAGTAKLAISTLAVRFGLWNPSLSMTITDGGGGTCLAIEYSKHNTRPATVAPSIDLIARLVLSGHAFALCPFFLHMKHGRSLGSVCGLGHSLAM
jgi:hypothetical protein